MQAWSGGRRERASSVVLLGKFSAMVRRGSLFQADPEDARASGDASSGDKDAEAGEAPKVVPTSPPSAETTAMTMWDPNSSGNNRSAPNKFLFYPARPLVAAALARPLSSEEMARRVALEAQIGSFADLHAGFAPPPLPVNEPELRREDEEEGQEEDEEEDTPLMDNNEQETLEEEERRAAFDVDEDAIQSEGEDEDCTGGDALLDFDAASMPASVRTLVRRIKSESLLGEVDMLAASASAAIVSNQDEEDEDDDDEEDEEVDTVDDVAELALDNNADGHDDENHDDEYEDKQRCSQNGQALGHELSPVEHRFLQRRRTHLLSCAAEQAALAAQDQLTSSVRRLVIQLKDDSDRVHRPLAVSHGIRQKSKAKPMRRRVNSCPFPYDPELGSVASPLAGSPLLTPPPMSPSLASGSPGGDHPNSKQQHKKSAFARIAPRVLETLHLRKKRKTYLFTDEELENIEGARWKIVELAFRFGGKHRSYLVQAVNMFFPLLKYGRRGGAHATRLHCNLCGTLQWQHKRGGLSDPVDLANVLQVLDGRQTAVFRKYASNSVLEACSFSVVFRGRTLDLETQSSSHRDWLVSALRTLVAYARRQRSIEQQAIAERVILPLDDDEEGLATPKAVGPSPVGAQMNLRRDDATLMAVPPNYTIRTVY
ncbi:hypothetical protein BBJ28_00009072 [Nothophytophthora sp. Chile5]|nr:hypothetical protein BBJ28_00009072 [Nothophytophthora sp. Chile5]